MILASILVNQLIPDYETPDLPVSISLALSSGPAEEILFFGLPFYISGNPFLVLITGAIWSLIHIFNTETITPNSLAYSGFLFTVPHVFFSLRTWISGKGWFAIVFSFWLEYFLFVNLLWFGITLLCSVC